MQRTKVVLLEVQGNHASVHFVTLWVVTNLTQCCLLAVRLERKTSPTNIKIQTTIDKWLFVEL